MAKIRLTKNELKVQKEALKRFTRYLPTLELKKQQLVNEIRNLTRAIEEIRHEMERVDEQVAEWVAVFGEDVPIGEFFGVDEVVTKPSNIAGIDIAVFNSVVFSEQDYDLMTTPLWVDRAIEVSKEQIERRAEIQTLEKQIEILREEMRITVQRINLFEKVKIPETKENIRKIRIYLGDMQTNAVVRGKIAKTKIQKKKELQGA